jgi:hypothetical protein
MGTANGAMTTPGAASWLTGRRGFVVAVAAAASALALALGQDWLAVADLVPLLFVLPCAVMMFTCIKGMNRGPQTGTAQAPAQSDTPAATDLRIPSQTEPVHWSG